MIEVCAGEANAWLSRYRDKKPAVACVLSFTDTGLLPGISTAGQTPAARCQTAALDGSFLMRSPHQPIILPQLPAGISPAVITRAVIHSLSLPCQLLSTGLPIPLSAPHISLPNVRAGCVVTGNAMSLPAVQQLFAAGQHWGGKLACPGRYLIIGECVVGGTTTAQAVLTGLGYAVVNRMSSSHRVGNHAQKQSLVSVGLACWHRRRSCAGPVREARGCESEEQLPPNFRGNSALGLVAAVGDPMQVTVAGMMLAASRRGGVLLAGGSQMLAVYALAKAIAQQQRLFWQPEQVVVGMTRWVIEDDHADTVAIARQIAAPYLASQINFSRSRWPQLRAYEQGFVKEGVGAGGCAIASRLYAHWSNEQLRHAVETELRFAY